MDVDSDEECVPIAKKQVVGEGEATVAKAVAVSQKRPTKAL